VDPIARIDRATEFAGGNVRRVETGDLGKPTPCAEYDVRTLLNHMIGNMAMAATAARGEKAALPEGDQFGSDAGAAYEERRQELLGAVRGAGALERTWELPFGTLDGSLMATIVFMEHLTHGWDVAEATGQDTTMPGDLVAECMGLAAPMNEMLRMPGVCGPAVSVPESASLQDKFIAFMGRTP
jgi:uncharacterized protein (TIGR03086 family)